MLRRMYAKHGTRDINFGTTIDNIYNHYYNNNAIATRYDYTTLSQLTTAPPPGQPGRVLHRKDFNPAGPIGLLLMTTHDYAAAIAPDFTIHAHNEQPLNIHNMPWQHLKLELVEVAKRARFRQVATHRTLLAGSPNEIDDLVLNRAMTKLAPSDQTWLHNIHNLGRWTSSSLERFAPEGDGACCHCGAPDAGLLHLLWECPKLQEARYDGDEELQQLKMQHLPPCWRIGLPSALPQGTTTQR